MVALLAQKAEVNYDRSITNITNVVKHVTDLGYQTSVLEDNAQGFSVVELAVSGFRRIYDHVSILNFFVIFNSDEVQYCFVLECYITFLVKCVFEYCFAIAYLFLEQIIYFFFLIDCKYDLFKLCCID